MCLLPTLPLILASSRLPHSPPLSLCSVSMISPLQAEEEWPDEPSRMCYAAFLGLPVVPKGSGLRRYEPWFLGS